MNAPVDICDAADKPSLPHHRVPLIVANAESARDHGCLVDDPGNFDIEITRWPAQGWRPVDEGTGDEGGVVEGIFHGNWRGDVLYGTNEAVNGNCVLGWSTDPQSASATAAPAPRDQVLLGYMNDHPDGGQLFYPLDNKLFVVPAALLGDDLIPDRVVAFWCDGTRGRFIRANNWHEGIFPVRDNQRFLDRQGRVHARVSCDFGKEFGVYLSVPLTRPEASPNPD